MSDLVNAFGGFNGLLTIGASLIMQMFAPNII
jgi:hypothetical protein